MSVINQLEEDSENLLVLDYKYSEGIQGINAEFEQVKMEKIFYDYGDDFFKTQKVSNIVETRNDGKGGGYHLEYDEIVRKKKGYCSGTHQSLVDQFQLSSAPENQGDFQNSGGCRTKRTSNNSLKPIFTCMKKIVLKLDSCYSGFFPFFMAKNQNSVKKQYFQWFISFSEFQPTVCKGQSISLQSFFDMNRTKFDELVEKQMKKRTPENIQRAKQTQEFVDSFYRALKESDYKERMKILFKGRVHSLKELECEREKFRVFSWEKKDK